MTRGRPRSYDEPVPVSLKAEKSLRDIMQVLKIEDPQVYAAGAVHLATERAGDLSEQQVQQVIQSLRAEMAGIQEKMAVLERVAMDARIRQDLRKKKQIETRFDERGRPYAVVKSE